MTEVARFSRTVEFKQGKVSLHEDGTATFHFRHMDYVYMPGRDTDDGMVVTLDAETSAVIKSLFHKDACGG